MVDRNRKTLRSFYCRDYIWELFEDMAREMGCSMDYLVNESMRGYARSRNYRVPAGRREAEGELEQTRARPKDDGATQKPPPLPGSARRPRNQRESRPQLSLLFNGQRYQVESDRFIIGRGSQQTDLTIRDGNISRQHCAVIYRGGNYFIKDLESTNGIEYNGQQVEHKRIEEGDIFYLCDYELRFTFR